MMHDDDIERMGTVIGTACGRAYAESMAPIIEQSFKTAAETAVLQKDVARLELEGTPNCRGLVHHVDLHEEREAAALAFRNKILSTVIAALIIAGMLYAISCIWERRPVAVACEQAPDLEQEH